MCHYYRRVKDLSSHNTSSNMHTGKKGRREKFSMLVRSINSNKGERERRFKLLLRVQSKKEILNYPWMVTHTSIVCVHHMWLRGEIKMNVRCKDKTLINFMLRKDWMHSGTKVIGTILRVYTIEFTFFSSPSWKILSAVCVWWLRMSRAFQKKNFSSYFELNGKKS